MVDVVLLGVSGAGKTHLFDLITNPDLRLSGVLSLDSEEDPDLEFLLGDVPVYREITELLLATRPAYAIVATPPAEIMQHVFACLECGCNVLCENPPGYSASTLRAIQSFANAQSLTIAISSSRRHMESWHRAKEWIQSGELGELLKFDVHWRSRPLCRNDEDQIPGPGGSLLLEGSHALDALLYLVGSLGKVHRANFELEGKHDVTADVEWCGSASAHVRLQIVDSESVHPTSFEIVGSNASIRIDGDGTKLVRNGEVVHQEAHRYRSRPIDDILRIERKEPLLGTSVDEALVVLQAITEAYNHAAIKLGGQWIRPRFKFKGRRSGSC